jgi:hypothetical protein
MDSWPENSSRITRIAQIGEKKRASRRHRNTFGMSRQKTMAVRLLGCE